jgi:drug/metabolite transporter (DMT)-like permease
MALNYTWALTLPLLAAPLLKQKLTKRDLIAATTSYIGIVVIATRGAPWTLSMAEPTGVMLALGSTVLWALCWIANTRHTLDPVVALFLNFCIASPLLLGIVIARGEWQTPSMEGLLGALYVGFFEMGISFICWLYAMRLTSSTARISTLIFLAPAISLILIAGVLDEPVHRYTLVGLAFILGGLFYQHRPVSD